MKIVCLDLEGVLIPEFWEEFSKATKIQELMLTTRDIPDYDELMQMRIKLLKENNLGINEIKEVVKTMNPFPGAVEFIRWLKQRTQPVIITGSYYDYIMPLIEKLEYPFTIANFLELDNDGAVTGYKLREKDGKIEMVNRFKEAGYKVIAAGDSFNDVKMLKGADKGILFKPCEKLKTQEQQLEVATNYEELKKLIEKEL